MFGYSTTSSTSSPTLRRPGAAPATACSTTRGPWPVYVCAVRKVEAVELVVCHVFNMADRDDQSVSMEMVRTRLARLREHPPGCWIGLCGGGPGGAQAIAHCVAEQWEWQTTATRPGHCADPIDVIVDEHRRRRQSSSTSIDELFAKDRRCPPIPLPPDRL